MLPTPRLAGIQSATSHPSGAGTAGTQSPGLLARRRLIVIALNLVTYVGLAAVMARVLSAGGWSVLDWVYMAAFLIGTPWSVLGFWNAVIGLWLLHGARDGLAEVAPFARAGTEPVPVTTRVAVLMTLRNEDPARAFARLRAVKRSLDATGFGAQYAYFILSDTNDDAVAAEEEAAHRAFVGSAGPEATIIYRRRTDNAGFKAGNVRDFCERWGHDYEFMLPLDADSLMTGEAILELTRIMQARPEIGILQSLVVGMPSRSAFARIFQFGMRAGMRAYTMGSAWWIGECGPFWGHNAMVRIAPFRDDCHLPVLPGKPPLGGAVMSHDQVEATLMRRAGYEVRVLPVENGSYEENPPTILEFARRDLRWCLGNMQYLKLMDIPGLKPMSRFQLAWAILMFIGVPCWTLMIALLPFKVIEDGAIPDFPAGTAKTLYVVYLLMYLMPKIAGFIDILIAPGAAKRYGGAGMFTLGAMTELVFSFLQGAVSTLRTTIFMAGLPFGRAKIGWNGQARDAHALTLPTALEGLWPHLVFGIVIVGSLAVLSPAVLLWSLPLTAGYLLAIPFAMITASPALGAWLAKTGLCAIPEDIAPSEEISAVAAGQAA